MKREPGNVFFRCVEDSNEAIMITDRDGKLIYVNPAWCSIYGYSEEEVIGSTPRIIQSGAHNPEFYADVWRCILDPTKGTWKGEIVNRSKSGTMIPVLLTITPYRNEEGEIEGYMGIAVDIRGRKDLELKVIRQDRLASVGMLASGLAHEVGTPLGIIRGRAELLQMMTSGNESVQSGLEVIVSQIDRISKLIKSLLRFSRGSEHVEIRPVHVREVVDEVIALVGQNLRQKGIETRIEVEPGLEVLGGFHHIEQILLNFVVNSVAAIEERMQKEGASASGSHFVKVTAQSLGGIAKIAVQDTGAGISRENLKKLFNPFFTTKDIGQGTGLGLAIVSKLIEEMQGEIQVESELGKGATFTISLPLARGRG